MKTSIIIIITEYLDFYDEIILTAGKIGHQSSVFGPLSFTYIYIIVEIIKNKS